jgi:hypothetical protein
MLRGPGGLPGELGADGDGRVEEVAAVGRAAYLDHDWDVAVLDLVFDSLVDTVDGPQSPVRRLRFAGYECTVEVVVSGDRLLTVDLEVSPGGPVVVESHTPGVRGPLAILWSHGRTMTWMRPQLTSFVLRWPAPGHLPVRTAWVPL